MITPETARAMLEALRASQELERLKWRLADCIPGDRRNLERQLDDLRRQVQSAIKQAEEELND